MGEPTNKLTRAEAEQRVFGEAFSFSNSRSVSPQDVAQYFKERDAAIEAGDMVWKVRTFDRRTGTVADLYRNTGIAAIMLYDIIQGGSAYGSSQLVGYHDTTLCEGATFADTVAKAEEFAANATRSDEPTDPDHDF